MKSSVLSLLGGLLLLTGVGCNHLHCDDGCVNDPIATASAVDFVYEGDFFNYHSADTYFWDTVLSDAFVTFEGINFYGVVQVRIFDDFGGLIFDEIFIGNGGTLTAKSISSVGFSGLWEVQIDSTGVDGLVHIILD